MSLATALSSCSSGCNQEKSNEQQAEVKKMPPKLVPTEKLHGKHFSDVYSYFLA
jgi:hypothetical protein